MTSAWLKIPSVAKSNFNIKMKLNNIPQMPFIKKLNEFSRGISVCPERI